VEGDPEQKRRSRREPGARRVIRIEVKDGMGHARWLTADLLDRSEGGLGISLTKALQPGTVVLVRGKLQERGEELSTQARVAWCSGAAGTYRAGLAYAVDSGFARPQETAAGADLDCYEIMQLSPNADADTVHRVYRILAQRYHPDNAHTGDKDTFVQLTEAFRLLSDPVQRAGYDARRQRVRPADSNLFDKLEAAGSGALERRKRAGILQLLYQKMMLDPEHAGMTVHDFERILGCPRENLQAATWYLRGKGHIQRSDNGRYAITVEGVDEAESQPQTPSQRPERLLTEAVLR